MVWRVQERESNVGGPGQRVQERGPVSFSGGETSVPEADLQTGTEASICPLIILQCMHSVYLAPALGLVRKSLLDGGFGNASQQQTQTSSSITANTLTCCEFHVHNVRHPTWPSWSWGVEDDIYRVKVNATHPD